MATKFDTGADTLSILNKQTSAQSDNLGALIMQLAQASEPVEKSFQGPARQVFDASVLNDLDLTPTEVAERRTAMADLQRASWAERESYTAHIGASERMGDAAARDAIRSQDADVVVDGAGAGAGQFDQVGLSDDGRTLIVAEAKGGSANLSTSGRLLPDGTRAAQGSTLYFNDVFRVDPTLQKCLADNPDVADGLADGTIDVRYQLVRVDGNGVVRIEDLALDAATLALALPAPVG